MSAGCDAGVGFVSKVEIRKAQGAARSAEANSKEESRIANAQLTIGLAVMQMYRRGRAKQKVRTRIHVYISLVM